MPACLGKPLFLHDGGGIFCDGGRFVKAVVARMPAAGVRMHDARRTASKEFASMMNPLPRRAHYIAAGSCACRTRMTQSVAQLPQNAAVSYDLTDGAAAATWLLSCDDVRQCTRSGGAAKKQLASADFARLWRGANKWSAALHMRRRAHRRRCRRRQGCCCARRAFVVRR